MWWALSVPFIKALSGRLTFIYVLAVDHANPAVCVPVVPHGLALTVVLLPLVVRSL